jgi:hypothetical protein
LLFCLSSGSIFMCSSCSYSDFFFFTYCELRTNNM